MRPFEGKVQPAREEEEGKKAKTILYRVTTERTTSLPFVGIS